MSAPVPVANGLRTDHPIPDLPFVDDSHIPVEDPAAVEAVGRNRGEDTWGREDQCPGGGWTAFTTDPRRADLAWCVRWHPEHGRSVVLYRDQDASYVHDSWTWHLPALLFRAGGYWWDGSTWYRPGQVWDAAAEDYFRRPVPAAMTVTAADVLDGSGDPARAKVLTVEEVDAGAPPPARWLDHVALWAQRHGDSPPLSQCVVKIAAPELTPDQLAGVAELAQIGGIAASTLRAYIARGEAEVPPPQAVVSGRSVWSRPVAEEWAEQRRRSHEGVTEAVSTQRSGVSLPQGIDDLATRYERIFFGALWENPSRRRRWALRWRNPAEVRALARDLSWYVAADVREGELISFADLGSTIRAAVLEDVGQQVELASNRDAGRPVSQSIPLFGIAPPHARMLGWLIRHRPSLAAHVIGEIIGEAARRYQIPRKVSEFSLRSALSMDAKKIDPERLAHFLELAFSPENLSAADDNLTAAE
jgi:hypothetical protein